MTLEEKLKAYAQRMAEEYTLGVEWKGDDYGARKRYYADAYRAGFAAAAQLLLPLVETVEGSLSVLEDTSAYMDQKKYDTALRDMAIGKIREALSTLERRLSEEGK